MPDESTPEGALEFLCSCVTAGRCPCGKVVLFDASDNTLAHVLPTCERFAAAVGVAEPDAERLPDAALCSLMLGSQGLWS